MPAAISKIPSSNSITPGPKTSLGRRALGQGAGAGAGAGARPGSRPGTVANSSITFCCSLLVHLSCQLDVEGTSFCKLVSAGQFALLGSSQHLPAPRLWQPPRIFSHHRSTSPVVLSYHRVNVPHRHTVAETGRGSVEKQIPRERR
jgi:hypothetical protein